MSYTAHMVQHVVLSQIVPLVLLLSQKRIAKTLAIRLASGVAWIVGVGSMVVTAMPAARAATDAPLMAWAMRLLLFVAGLAFWSPIVAGTIRPPLAVAYLVTACFATTLAGVYIAFTATTSDQQVAGLIMWVPCCLVFLSAALMVVGRMLARPASDRAAP